MRLISSLPSCIRIWSKPTTSKLTPLMRMYWPRAGAPENSFSLISLLRTATRAWISASRRVKKRPSASLRAQICCVANEVVIGGDAGNLPVGGGVIADRLDITALQHGGDAFDRRGLGGDIQIVLLGQVVLPHAHEAAFDAGGPSGKNKHNIVAQGGHLSSIARAKALPHPHQKEQGTDAPGDAEHGEKRAQFVRPESAANLP